MLRFADVVVRRTRPGRARRRALGVPDAGGAARVRARHNLGRRTCRPPVDMTGPTTMALDADPLLDVGAATSAV